MTDMTCYECAGHNIAALTNSYTNKKGITFDMVFSKCLDCGYDFVPYDQILINDENMRQAKDLALMKKWINGEAINWNNKKK